MVPIWCVPKTRKRAALTTDILQSSGRVSPEQGYPLPGRATTTADCVQRPNNVRTAPIAALTAAVKLPEPSPAGSFPNVPALDAARGKRQDLGPRRNTGAERYGSHHGELTHLGAREASWGRQSQTGPVPAVWLRDRPERPRRTCRNGSRRRLKGHEGACPMCNIGAWRGGAPPPIRSPGGSRSSGVRPSPPEPPRRCIDG